MTTPFAVADHIPCAANRMQQSLGETFINLRAQPRDVHVDDVGLRVEMVIPHVLEQHGASHDLTRVLHEIFEQAELARLQNDLVACAGYLMRQPVELEIADAIDRLLAAPAPTRQHLRAREQLRKRIGLGKIVVTARPQPLDPIINLAERRKDERRRLDTLAAQGADDRQTVELGQHAIDDQHVILAVERVGESLLAVGRQVGDMPDLAECLRQIVGGVAIVFDDQETHDESAVSWISDVPRRGTVLDCTNHSGTISKCPGVGPRGDGPSQREKCEGRRFDPPPLNQLRTGGGDGCRNEVRRDGDGRRARPPGSNRRRGRRMPTVRPIRSGLAEPQRNELRRVARLHPHEDRTLAVLLRVFERAADIGRIGNLLAADLENDVAGLDALVGGNPVGIDLGNHHAFGAAAGDLAGGYDGEAEARHVGALRAGGVGHRRRARLTLVRQFAERDGEALLLAFAPYREFRGGTRRHAADLPGEVSGVVDRSAVDRRDPVTGHDRTS